jgi:DNA-binding response OmpR family regulator
MGLQYHRFRPPLAVASADRRPLPMTPTCDILVIEDDPDLAESLRDALGQEGYDVTIAPDGLVALEMLRREKVRPRLIILDLMMPAVNGWEFHAAVRTDPTLGKIPVVVLSALIDERQQTWLGVAPENCIRKPFELSTLIAAVDRHCRR